jgi:hypothetical protein
MPTAGNKFAIRKTADKLAESATGFPNTTTGTTRGTCDQSRFAISIFGSGTLQQKLRCNRAANGFAPHHAPFSAIPYDLNRR